MYVQESDSKTRKAAGTLFPEAVVHFVDPDDCVVREAKTLFHKIPETEPYLPFYRYRAWVLYSTRFSIRPEYECENSDTMSCESLPQKIHVCFMAAVLVSVRFCNIMCFRRWEILKSQFLVMEYSMKRVILKMAGLSIMMMLHLW